MLNSQYWSYIKVQMVLCGMQGVNLKTDTIKILKINFSYNASFENYDNCNNHIIEIKKTY